jgi:hypothetical protein
LKEHGNQGYFIKIPFLATCTCLKNPNNRLLFIIIYQSTEEEVQSKLELLGNMFKRNVDGKEYEIAILFMV